MEDADETLEGLIAALQERAAEIAKLEKEMKEAAKLLEFEYAAVLRDRIVELKKELLNLE